MQKPQKEGRVSCAVEGLPDIEAIGPFDMLAYTAAFVDGDGSMSMTKKGRSPSISVYNNNSELLASLIPIIGGNKPHRNHRGEYQLRIARMSSVKKVCELLLPKLITRREQAKLLMSACGLSKDDRAPIGDALSALNKKKDFVRPADTVSIKIATTKSSTDWSYLGGYADTDSCIGFTQQCHGSTVYYYPYLHVYCKNPEPILWLQSRFGGQYQSRKRKTKWISSLEFEDQAHVLKILQTLRPYVLDKMEQIDIVSEACMLPAKDRHVAAARIREINDRFSNLREFHKTEEGKYVDSRRSKKKPHRTHKGVPFKDTPPSPPQDPEPPQDQGVDL